MALTVQTGPASEPISVTELKTHLRIDTTAHDAYLAVILTSARQYYESHADATLVTTTYDLYLDGFHDPKYSCGGVISLPRPPAASVSTITYYDTANVLQTWSSTEYATDLKSEPARIKEAFGYTYPLTYDKPGSVIIRYVAGLASAAIPEKKKQAVRFLAGHLFENREASAMGAEVKAVPMAYDAFTIMDQVWTF